MLQSLSGSKFCAVHSTQKDYHVRRNAPWTLGTAVVHITDFSDILLSNYLKNKMKN